MGSIPVGVTNATLAQLVEQLTCGIDKQLSLFWTILHLYRETYKVDIANSGKTKYLVYVNPELEKKFLSVETLYDVPKV